jgi:CRP/FNR family transcriptional regulator, nitrogen oxide reductase regulator
LLRLAGKYGQRQDDSGVEIPWPLSRRDIGAVSGTALYTASRILASWERTGILATTRRRIKIAMPAELARMSEGVSLVATS